MRVVEETGNIRIIHDITFSEQSVKMPQSSGCSRMPVGMARLAIPQGGLVAGPSMPMGMAR